MKGVLRTRDIVELIAPHDAATMALITAIIAAGGSIASSEISSSAASSQAEKNRKAAADAAAKQTKDAQATESKTLSDQIKQVIAAKRGTATPGLSPDFLAQEIETQFPGNEDLIKQLVSSSFSTGG